MKYQITKDADRTFRYSLWRCEYRGSGWLVNAYMTLRGAKRAMRRDAKRQAKRSAPPVVVHEESFD